MSHLHGTSVHCASLTTQPFALPAQVIGYAIYSLIYKPHKSWYSWVLNVLVQCVYLFGFILMCPQVTSA